MGLATNVLFMLQGLFVLGNGLYMMALPESAAQTPQFEGTPPQVMLLTSMPTLSVGALFVYAAYFGDRGIMKLSILGRALATVLFVRAGGPLRGVGIYEGTMAVLTGSALWLERGARV